MDDKQVLDRIGTLVEEEHALERQATGEGLDQDHLHFSAAPCRRDPLGLLPSKARQRLDLVQAELGDHRLDAGAPDLLVYVIDAASSIILVVCLVFVTPRPQKRSAEPRSWRSFSRRCGSLRPSR